MAQQFCLFAFVIADLLTSYWHVKYCHNLNPVCFTRRQVWKVQKLPLALVNLLSWFMSLVARMGGLALHLFLCFLSLQVSEMVQSYVLVSSLLKSFNLMMVCIYLKIYTYVNLPTKDNYSLRLPFHGWHNIQCDTQAVRVEAHFYFYQLK